MTDKQKLELRQSTIRSRLAELGAAEGTEDGKAEIDTLAVEYGSNETRMRAFLIANDEPVETTTTNKEGQEGRSCTGAPMSAIWSKPRLRSQTPSGHITMLFPDATPL